MYTIKKDSLLHRFNVSFGIQNESWWDEQTNGCPYFWGTIASILKFIIYFIIFVGLPTGLFSGLGYNAMRDVFGKDILETSWIWASPLFGLAIFSAIVLVAFAVAGIVICLGCGTKNIYQKITKTSTGESNFFFVYIKAKKNKYCPRIQIK